jgi:uncharacterized membrane protein YozB (DUF420 family)
VNDTAITLATALLLVALVAGGVMLVSNRRPDGQRLARVAFGVVMAILLVFVAIAASSFLEGWYGGIPD